MDWFSLIILACALAMDAFAVALVTGLTLNPLNKRQVFRLAFHFGLFQALMPLAGWMAGAAVYRHIASWDHWVAFGLLAFIGVKMLRDALCGDDDHRSAQDPTTGWSLVLLSVATSIDALAVGITLAMLGTTILVPSLVIGLTAAAFTVTGMILGRRIGSLWGRRVEAAGGLLLMAIGGKILLEHLPG